MTLNQTDYLVAATSNPVNNVLNYVPPPSFLVFPGQAGDSSLMDRATSFVTLLNFRKAVVSILLLSAPFIFNYIATWLVFWISHLSKKALKVPPATPYMVPFLGSTYRFAFEGLNFVRDATWQLGRQAPFRVALFRTNLYFAHGAENIISLFRNSSSMTGTPIQLFCLKHLFGMPTKALEMYSSDNSGLNAQPLPGTRVAPHNRVDHLTHVSLVKFTSGKGLSGFYARWIAAFKSNLLRLDISNEWVVMPDFTVFFKEEFGSAATDAICGPLLRQVNPRFMQDLDEYDQCMPYLTKGFPRWMIPESYAVRDKLLNNIKEWHAIARTQFKMSSIDADGDYDPYWGSEFMRTRQVLFAKIDNFDYEAYAASDLGFIWATNTNIIPSSFWATMEIFRDPALLSRVRSELRGSFHPVEISKAHFDIDKLLKNSLLQSIYSETLRLRIQMYIMRYTDREELRLNQWLFPKQSIVLVSTVPAQMDENVWNTGKDNANPVDKFWADRFLVYPDNPDSGPCSKAATRVKPDSSIPQPVASSVVMPQAPKFSLSGTAGHFIPYGGGPRVCPGRHFAKRGIISACAIMATMFDVEILADEKALEMDPAFHGLGGQHPVGKVPFRIRKRQGSF